MHKERMEKMVRDADRYGAGFGYGTDRFTGDGGRGRGRGRSRGGRGQGDGFGRHGGPGGFGPGFGPGFGGPMFGRGPKVGRGDVRAAIMQVAQAGTPAQVSTVQEILVQTRRRIYQVLADDGSETGGDATAGSPATGGPDGPGTTDAG